MIPQPYISGRPVGALAPLSDLTLTASWPVSGAGGPSGAKFNLLLPQATRPGWIAKGAPADVRLGSGLPILAGEVAEVDWDTGAISIDGACTEGDESPCVTAANVPSSTPDVVFAAAIGRGAVSWSLPASISATPLVPGDTTANLNSITDMVGAFCDKNAGARVFVDQYRSIRLGADPTTPQIFLEPGVGELSWVSESQATRIFGQWVDANGVLSTTVVGSGTVEKIADLTTYGPLTSTQVNTILGNTLAKSTAGGWNGGLVVSPQHTLGMIHPATLYMLACSGLMARKLGQFDPRPDRLPVNYIDFVVDRAEWNVPNETVQLSPRGMVSRDFESILAEAISDAGLQQQEAA